MWFITGSPSSSSSSSHDADSSTGHSHPHHHHPHHDVTRRSKRCVHRFPTTLRMSPSRAPPLAIELVLEILEILAEDEQESSGGKSSSSLLVTSRVCRSWSTISQALLFRTVKLSTLKSADALVAAISGPSLKSRFLRDSISALDIIVSDEEAGRVITQHGFARILKLCPNVQDLRLFYYCLRALDPQTLDIIRTIPAPISLALHCAQHPSPLWDLMTLWPSIQHLEVVSWELPTENMTQSPPPRASWSPYEVRWLDEADSGESSLPRLLRPGSLKILQLTKTPTEEYFEELMEAHGPHLRSLRLRHVEDEMADSIVRCESLEEFKYQSVPSERLLKALPADTLEHLEMQNGTIDSDRTSILPVIDWVERRAKRLRAITYNACGSPSTDEFRRLSEVCKAKSIELQCFADATAIKDSEPLVRPERFPRPQPLVSQRRQVTFKPVRRPDLSSRIMSRSSSMRPTLSKSGSLKNASYHHQHHHHSTHGGAASTSSGGANDPSSSASAVPTLSKRKQLQRQRLLALTSEERIMEGGFFSIKMGL